MTTTATTTSTPRRRRGPIAATIGVFGELLITAGVLLGLFIVWQLWWTDVEAHAHQTEVQQDWREAPSYVEAPEQAGEKRYDAPPTPDTPGYGDVMATLHIPRLGDDYEATIAHGVGMHDVLNQGYVGHYPDTQLPGEIGNFATAGHRQSYGAPYREVEQIQHGDELIVETNEAYLVYDVTGDEIVHPSQIEVIAPVPNRPDEEPIERQFTLTTCHPLFSAAQRWITYSQFDHWVDKADGRPEALIEGVS